MQALQKNVILARIHFQNVLWLRKSARRNVIAKLGKGFHALGLQAIIFGGKIAVDLGVARNMAAVFTQNILGKEILRIAAGAGVLIHKWRRVLRTSARDAGAEWRRKVTNTWLPFSRT